MSRISDAELVSAERYLPAAGHATTTVQQHILQDQKRFPGASGEFSWLLSGITLATKMIQAKVRQAGLDRYSRRTRRRERSRRSAAEARRLCQRDADALPARRGPASAFWPPKKTNIR